MTNADPLDFQLCANYSEYVDNDIDNVPKIFAVSAYIQTLNMTWSYCLVSGPCLASFGLSQYAPFLNTQISLD